MSKAEILFLNNKAMDELGAASMKDVINDVERVYVLTHEGDVIAPGKCVMRWGNTVEDENTLSLDLVTEISGCMDWQARRELGLLGFTEDNFYLPFSLLS